MSADEGLFASRVENACRREDAATQREITQATERFCWGRFLSNTRSISRKRYKVKKGNRNKAHSYIVRMISLNLDAPDSRSRRKCQKTQFVCFCARCSPSPMIERSSTFYAAEWESSFLGPKHTFSFKAAL